MFKKTHAFTLIELLIVVAIIAILAAIAVPNFLEAQTRAKVSRFMSDIRSCATALESYRVDTNHYPKPDQFPAGSDPGTDLDTIVSEPAELYLPRRLTTPIAYLSTLPIDILRHSGPPDPPVPYWHAPHYINDEFNSTATGTPMNTWGVDLKYFSARTKGALKIGADPGTNEALYDRSVVWHIHSHGPDGDHDDFAELDRPYPVAYDPTNGTTSDGDVFYFGPGTGFHK